MPNDEQLKNLNQTIEEVVAFPLLTHEASRARRSSSAVASTSNTAIAQQTVHDALGWRYRQDDPRGFVAALSKACTLRETDGHVEWQWNTQPFMLQAELGELSGALKSVFKQAQNAVEQAVPLLNSLAPLRPDVDLDNAEAIRTLVRGEMYSLVNELGQQAGPRVQRAELFFKQLLGEEEIDDPEQVEGSLGRLRDRFGLERRRVNTVDEEQNFTNYLILVDYIVGLRKSFKAKAQYFGRKSVNEPFLGTQLVLLSRQLEVIYEQVQETYDSMDSVFFGAAERQTTVIPFAGQAPITVTELLDWVEMFASREGRQLIEDGGKDGIVSFRQNAELLNTLVAETAAQSANPGNNPARAFHSKRVATTLEGLSLQLKDAVELSKQISRRPIRQVEDDGGEENRPLPVPPPVVQVTTEVTDVFAVEFKWYHTNGHGDDVLNDPAGGREVEQGRKYRLVIRGRGLRNAQFFFDTGIKKNGFREDRSSETVILGIDVDNDAVIGIYSFRYQGRDQPLREKRNALEVVVPRPSDTKPIDASLCGHIHVEAGKKGTLELKGSELGELGIELDDDILLERTRVSSGVLHIDVLVTVGANLGWHGFTLTKPGVPDRSFAHAIYVKAPSKAVDDESDENEDDPTRTTHESAQARGSDGQQTQSEGDSQPTSQESSQSKTQGATSREAEVAVRGVLKKLEISDQKLVGFEDLTWIPAVAKLKSDGLSVPGPLSGTAARAVVFNEAGYFPGTAENPGRYRFELPAKIKPPLSLLVVGKDGTVHYAVNSVKE